jgi:uroporphyrinogen decarboxylase
MGNEWKLKSDKMTSSERVNAFLSGEEVDHIGFYPFARGFCAKVTGETIEKFYIDPEKSFESQLWTQQMFGHEESLKFGAANFGSWEFGGEIKLPASEWQQAPSTTVYPVETEEDVDKLEIPDIKTAGMIPLNMEFSKIQEKNDVIRTVVLGSPFLIAANVCSMARLSRWMIKKPELVHRVLQLSTAFGISLAQYWVDTFGGEKVEVRDATPTESNQVISPQQFKEFSFPYLMELHEKVLAMGVKHFYTHICGDQNLNLPYLAEIPYGDPGIVSFGHEVDISKTLEYFDKHCIVVGNVEPALLQTKRPKDIYELSKQCIQKGMKASRGFFLGSGCELPPMTPSCNVWAMKKAINDFGWFK